MKKINHVTESDKELIQMYRNGDSSAFGIIVKRHSCHLGAYIFSIVKDTMLAEDILQETFMKAMVALKSGKYEEEEIFKYWLLRIAHNLCMDHKRREKKRGINCSLTKIKEEENYEFYVFPNLYLTEPDFDIHQLINNLPLEQKEVVILRIFHNFSFTEISDFTNVSVNTALGRMRYALINLRKQIGEIKIKKKLA